MTIKDIKELINEEGHYLQEEEIKEAIEFFKDDSDDEVEYISEFLRFCFLVGRQDSKGYMDDLHLCNQKYVVSVSKKPELKKKHLSYLLIKDLEYFTIVNSYSECIRTINEIMDLEDVPDYCMGACLSQAMEIFLGCGLKKEAEKYIEATRVFSNICDLPARNLIMIDCNLLQAYASLGQRSQYEYFRKNVSRYPESALDEGVMSLVKLYVLGSEAIIDRESEPSREYVREVCELMEQGSFHTGLTADFSEMMVPILTWIKDYLPMERIVGYTLKMIDASEVTADRLDMYALLTDTFEIDRYKYAEVYDAYYKTLKEYYANDCEIRRHEVVGEMLSYELEKQYRDRALKDELTGIGNRHAYESEIDGIVGESANGKVPDDVTIFSMDVNGLKHVNDTYGHQAGDDYIRGAADSLKTAVGNYGHIFRTGGDEFAAIIRIRQFPSERIIEVLRKTLSEWSDSYGNELTMSVGVASSSENPGCSLEELISFADEAMYKDKRKYYQQTGKDRRQR